MATRAEETAAKIKISSSEVFAAVQHLSSRIDENRVSQVVDAVEDLATEDKQLIVDLLSTTLEINYHLLKHADRVLSLLTQIASSAQIIAHNRILNHGQLPSNIYVSSGVYIVHGSPPSSFRVIKRGKRDDIEAFSKAFSTWSHLSHPNVLPIYGAFPDGIGGPVTYVSPLLDMTSIVEYAKTLVQAKRMTLIFDVIEGLCYLHRLGTVHGGLNPESVLIDDSGRALLTDLDPPSRTFAIRYLAPELVLEDEDTDRTKAADVWALGCLCYELLSGNIPFCQYRREVQVSAAVAKGKKPTRPGRGETGGESMTDIVWRLVLACWEFEPEDRPSCLGLRNAFSTLVVHDDRPISKLMIRSAFLGENDALPTDLHRTMLLFSRILRSDELLSPPSRIPEHLHERLTGLVGNNPRVEAITIAAKKFSVDDTQLLLDVLDLVLEENPSSINLADPVVKVLTKLMASTRIFPQRYKVHRILYDPSSVAEERFGKVFKGCDLDVFVNTVTDSSDVANLIDELVVSVHSSHPNVLPFYGVFDEVVNGIPRFCLVSPYMKNGTLHDFAPRLPQRSRISLIRDVIMGLDYLHHEVNVCPDVLRPDTILISDEGRALVAAFFTARIVMCTMSTGTRATRSSYSDGLRFRSPESARIARWSLQSDIWSVGCISYKVLSGKSPYHEYQEESEIKSALSRGQPPKRPSPIDGDIDLIGDQLWELIIGCCRLKPEDRLTISEIQKLLVSLRVQDDRMVAGKLPNPAIMSLRRHPDIDWDHVKRLLDRIQVELLRNPLSKLVQNRIKDVAEDAVQLRRNDVQTLVDFLDLTLKDHLTISDDRNRVLALLSRIMTLTRIFPQRHELKDIQYSPQPIAEGGFGKVHRGLSDPALCVKVTTRVDDPHALIAYIQELILWAHLSHENVLPFYGVFFNDSQQICLVSPYITKGNLRDYAPRLAQRSRVPLLLDTINGLVYLHGPGIVHTDLKGENVLISDEGRGLITDFGASHIVTATAKAGATTGSVSYTLRFTAPEIIQDQTLRLKPTKECDIWSFGCLCYQVLSRKLPYYEYQLDAQVLSALYRGQLPKRPGPPNTDSDDDEDWEDEADGKDWDDLDDAIWDLITKCLVLKPEDRPSAAHVQELIVDMKAWDPRPLAKDIPGVEILKQKSDVEINLNRAGTLLDDLQILFLARRIIQYSSQEVVTAVADLSREDVKTLTSFWALVLNRHLSELEGRSRLLAIHSAVTTAQQRFQAGYCLQARPRYNLKVIAEGSFGKIHRGSELNVCVKVTDLSQMDSRLKVQWFRAVISWVHSSHPNILPFYGMFLEAKNFLVSPFIERGNLKNYVHGLPEQLRMLLMSDVTEGLLYLHKLGIIHSNLKTENVLISDEGRGLITDFRPYHASVAAAAGGPTGSYITSTLRFTAPELIKDSQMLPSIASDVWSVGCLFYEVLSRKVPYHTCTEDLQIRSSLSRDELLMRPIMTDNEADEIDDKSWDLIMKCCAIEPERRLKLSDIQTWLRDLGLEDNRPEAKPLPGAEILKERFPYVQVDIARVGEALNRLEARLPKTTEDG